LKSAFATGCGFSLQASTQASAIRQHLFRVFIGNG
jgi:hypothetical protein